MKSACHGRPEEHSFPQKFKVYSDEQGNGHWLLYDDVIKFLSTNVSDSDQKSFHHGNAARLLKKDGVKTISDKKIH